jgi:hypothetical protein
MNTKQTLEKARYELSQLFSLELADDCINYLVSRLIGDIVENDDRMSDEEIGLLFDAGLDQLYTYESEDIISVILEMAAMARERSHGGAPLSRVYISSKDYNTISEQLNLNDKSVITVGKVRVYKSDALTKFASVFGICKPKFKCVSPELIVILGKVKE